MVPAGWQRTLRAVTLGLLTPGSAAGVDSERELVAKVRARRREPSVTAFLAGKGGMGTTTLAAGVGLTLAALRNDTTALVDLHRGPALLGRRLAGRTAATLSQLADTPPEHDPPELLRVGGALAMARWASGETSTTQMRRHIRRLAGVE
jgi:hypothetical protein